MPREEFLTCGKRLGLSAGSNAGPNIKSALLGKTSRYAPDRAVDTLHVRLDLEIDFKKRGVAGSCETTIRAFRDGIKSVEFDAVGLKVSGVTVDGKARPHKLDKEKIRVNLGTTLSSGEEAKVKVRYRTEKPPVGLHFVFPGRHNPKNPVQVWSQSQPEDARWWFPCHDSPHEKCTSEMRVTVPKGFLAVSNGDLVETVHRGAKSTYHWRLSQPHSIYLISLAAGRFSEVRDSWDGIPVQYYCEKGREAEARIGFAKTPKVLEFFSRATGVRYPYGKYAQVAVAEYPGGMEHTTCTTQTDALLIDRKASLDNELDLLVAHELAHQWFGDLVTCRDWSHAWLNEGFATYFEVLFTGHDKGSNEADYEMFQNAKLYFDEDSRRYRRPVVCNTFKAAWTVFDRHTYEKGAWILHMLKGELGTELWWKSIRHYVRKHANQSVETLDLVTAIEEATGRNLRPFFDQWVFRGGYPSLRIRYHWDRDARKAHLWLMQTQDVSDAGPAFRLPLKIRFSGRGWTRDFAHSVSEREHRWSWRLPSEPEGFEVDPEHVTLMRLDLRKPHAMWLRQLRAGASAWSRHAAASQAARWGDPASAALILAALRREPFWGAAVEMARALGSMRTQASYEALRDLLNVAHPRVRRAVVEEFAAHGRVEAGPALARVARTDPSYHVRAAACRGLGSLDLRRYRPLLKEILGKDSYRDILRAGALGGLAASRDPKVLETLKKASLPPHAFFSRVQAIRSLADFAPAWDGAVPWLCRLARDPDERVNLAVISTLGQLEDERSLPTLEASAKSSNSRVRTFAEEALAKVRAGGQKRATNGTKD